MGHINPKRLFYMYFQRSVLISSFSLLTLFSATAYAAPTCQSSASDTDGDGWGYENGQSCEVSSSAPQLGAATAASSSGNGGQPICTGSNADPDGDGWGYENGQSCQMPSGSSNTNASTNSGGKPLCQGSNPDPDGDGWGYENGQSCQMPSGSSSSTGNYNSGDTPVERYGKISVCGNGMCDQNGNRIQLKGLSTHGIQWYGWGHCLTENSLDVFAYQWDVDVVRIAMYVQSGGYESDPAGYTAQVNKLIDELSYRGQYVIVDFHILTPGDPGVNVENAKTFFDDIVSANAWRTNVMYEIANEPHGVKWYQIKSFADEVIPVIRKYDNDAIVIVGTRGWSSLGVSENGDHNEIVADPINDSQVMYTFHFYANSHYDKYFDVLESAIKVLPIFVTEWGTQDASGGGKNNFINADRYMKLLADNKVGFTGWNASDSHESSAMWKPSTCQSDHNWNEAHLQDSGKYLIRKIQE